MFSNLVGEDLHFLRRLGIAKLDSHEEAVELSFGEGIRAFELDGVLGGDDEERLWKQVRFSIHGHLPLLHAFEEAGLGAGRSPVNFIAQEDLGEDGAWKELEPLPGRIKNCDA